MKRERVKSTIAVVIISLIFLLAGYIEVKAYVGQLCNWSSDCDWGETCQTVPYINRDSKQYDGVCVPKN